MWSRLRKLFVSLFQTKNVKEKSKKQVEELPSGKQSFHKIGEYSVEIVEDVPEFIKFEDKTIYLVGENELYWLAAFNCPCGCYDKIQLNLLKDSKPCWEVKDIYNGVSIWPSIDRIVGCNCHFIIRDGNAVHWVDGNSYFNG